MLRLLHNYLLGLLLMYLLGLLDNESLLDGRRRRRRRDVAPLDHSLIVDVFVREGVSESSLVGTLVLLFLEQQMLFPVFLVLLDLVEVFQLLLLDGSGYRSLLGLHHVTHCLIA